MGDGGAWGGAAGTAGGAVDAAGVFGESSANGSFVAGAVGGWPGSAAGESFCRGKGGAVSAGSSAIDCGPPGRSSSSSGTIRRSRSTAESRSSNLNVCGARACGGRLLVAAVCETTSRRALRRNSSNINRSLPWIRSRAAPDREAPRQLGLERRADQHVAASLCNAALPQQAERAKVISPRILRIPLNGFR